MSRKTTQTLPFVTLDVFTNTPYAGNPLGIITLPTPSPTTPPLTQDQLQLLAREFNLSEVVFLHPPSSPTTNSRRIQIFTTHNELPLAGHPVVGTAHYVLKILGLRDVITSFETKGCNIPISIDSETGFVKAIIPQSFMQHVNATFKSSLNEKENPAISLLPGLNFIPVELSSLEALAKAGDEGNGNLAAKPFQPELYLGEGNEGGIIGTKYFVAVGGEKDGKRGKFRTRMFAHVEDSGTGSACSALACWLALNTEGGVERKFQFEQGVEMGRRNEIFVDVKLSDGLEKKVERLVLSGGAVKVMEGSLTI